MTTSVNPNLQWADLFVSELAACGLPAVCIAPGSRSTPLTLAFARQPAIKSYLLLDERSAAFFALGLALATNRPVALVCTSGTAAAEFHAAIIEAYQSQVPLLILTADRPHEVRYSGANQTIDQVKMYGDHVLWSFDLSVPQANAPALTIRALKTLASRAYGMADGVVKGPVHLNFPFRQPLEPATPPLPAAPILVQPTVRIERGVVAPMPQQVAALATIINQSERGLIVCGPGCPGGAFPAQVAAFAQASGYPLIADPLSGIRFGPAVTSGLVLGGYESYLQGGQAPWERPDVVIRFGAVPTGKWINSYLSNSDPAHLIHIRENGVWADDSHLVTYFLQADPATVCAQVTAELAPRPLSAWAEAIQGTEATCQQVSHAYCQEHFFDGAVVAAVVAALPAGARLMIGNSLPVRHLDQLGTPTARALTVYGNRGASGIDGVTSTALGIAATSNAPLVLLTGDVAFYHDMNGLLAIKQQGLTNVTIVLLNNNGGSIFRRLPIAKFEPEFTPFFLTPHDLDFSHVAQLYGLHHLRASDPETFRAALQQSLDGQTPTLLEVQTDGAADYDQQQALTQQLLQTSQRPR
ncbi:MAG: 2-succinyl-5-enolpyruvyl-6-hydroxy-3-cyclohexene-1-carboxylic-acid synthase [Caldilineaceae bacterium]|nr:2-succinyl-5-enolpyruvyl-6-hydroxy-3-cyclohexene-1-carboxylic-acid synthase [Caldilineaceae bacterium]